MGESRRLLANNLVLFMNWKSFHCGFCCISAGLMWDKMHWIQMFLFIKTSLEFTKKKGLECNVATKGNMLANQANICDLFPPSWEQKNYKVSDSQNKIHRMAEPSASVFIGLSWPLKLFVEMEAHHNFHENIHTQKDKQINTRHWGGIFTSCGAIFRPMARKISHFETAFMKFGELTMHQLCNIVSHRHIDATFCRKSRVWWKKKIKWCHTDTNSQTGTSHTHTIRKHLEYPSQTDAAVALKL